MRKTFQRFVLAALLFGAGLMIGNSARAADPLTVQIVNPTPNVLHLYGTPLLFEAAITAGAESEKYYRISWDFLYTGGATEGYDQVQTPFFYNAAAYDYATSINFLDDTAQFWYLRYVLLPDDHFYTYTPNESYTYRAQVEMCGDLGCSNVEATASVNGSFSLYDGLGFTGFAYAGASTGKCVDSNGYADPMSSCTLDKQCGSGRFCGGDAPGYAAFNCTLQQASTCATPYSVLYGVVGPTGHASLQNYSWFGQSDDVASGRPLGWLTFNKNSCMGGSSDGLSCFPGADCGGGVCTVLANVDKPPVSGAGSDPENWADRPEMNRIYSAVEDVSGTQRLPGQLAGWGRLLTLADYGETFFPKQNDWGWVHLRGKEASKNVCSDGSAPCAGNGECSTNICLPASNTYSNLATGGYQQCTDCAADTNGISPKCNICGNVVLSNTKFCTVGEAAKIGTICTSDSDCGNNGLCEQPAQSYACNSCYNCDTVAGTCDQCEQCARYGVSFDTQRGQLLGYGWAGGEQNGEGGLGWVRFNPAGGVSILQGWLATRYGDIFSGGSISSRAIPPAGSYNATYIIQANDTIVFSSQFGASNLGYVRPNYPNEIRIPSAPTKYVNVLGRINFSEITIADDQVSPKRHRYGTTRAITSLKDIPGWTIETDHGRQILKIRLDNTIYYYQGNLQIPDAVDYDDVQILAGTTEDETTTSGAGTIIVDGNVILSGNMAYETPTTPLDDIIKIPSLGWIIRGDLTINPLVSNLVGAFLVLGCPGDESVTTCDSLNQGTVNQGTVHTGYSLDLPLVVKGLIMARSIVFERNIVGNLGAQGSEQVIYDGRFIANPPPGLQDLSAAVPSLRLDVPQ